MCLSRTEFSFNNSFVIYVSFNSLIIKGFMSNYLNEAFIPLADFSDAEVMKKYGLKPVPEAIDIAKKATQEKNVL